MPSLTLIVPNSSGYPPAACTPSLLALASRSRLRLQGVISFQELATPIWGFAKSSSPRPTARSMPREAVASRPSVTFRLRGLMSCSTWLWSVVWLTVREPTPQAAVGRRAARRGHPAIFDHQRDQESLTETPF